MSDEYGSIHVDKVKRKTAKAFLFVIEKQEHWFPISQLESPDDINVGDTDIEVAATEWIISQKMAGD